MAILKHIIPIAIAALTASCYEDFTPKVDTQPVLCINALITAGETFDVHVSRTWRYDAPETDHNVNDADVTIYANGNPVGRDYIACEGDEIRIIVTSPTYGEAEATVTVPHAVQVDQPEWVATVTSTWTGGDLGGGDSEWLAYICHFTLDATLNVHDSADTPDYYRFSFDTYNDNDWSCDIIQGTLQYKQEPIFSEHIGQLESVMGAETDGFSLFSDRQFPGSRYPLHLQWREMSWMAHDTSEAIAPIGLRLSIASVSESYYKYALFCWHTYNGILIDLGDTGFGEPLWAYSNVSTGAGIVAAQAVTSRTIDLKDFIRQTINHKSRQ